MKLGKQAKQRTTLARSQVRALPVAAVVSVTVLLGLVVADGVRNWAPSDIRTADPMLAELPDDTAASFPYAGLRDDEAVKTRECAGPVNGPAITGARPVGDQGRWLTSIDYPLASLDAGHEGISAVRMTIDRRGMVAHCRIVRSSGHALLDAAACSTLQSRARYDPARDADGCPVPTTIGQRVRWQIPIGQNPDRRTRR